MLSRHQKVAEAFVSTCNLLNTGGLWYFLRSLLWTLCCRANTLLPLLYDMADGSALPGQVLPPKGLAHVVLRTSNYKPMVAFYKVFLGAHATFENDILSFLTYDEEHHRLAIGNVPGTTEKVPTSAGLEHIAFQFESLNHLLTTYQQRKARGILPFWCVNHGPTTSIYYQDPDGNQLETQVDNFDTVEAASAMMLSPEYAENPLGVDFDPEDIIRRLKDGESEGSIKRRANIGPRGIESIPKPPPRDVRTTYNVLVN